MENIHTTDRPLTIDERKLIEAGQEILHQLFGECDCDDPISHLAHLIQESEEE